MNSKATRTRFLAFSTVSSARFPGPLHRARPERVAARAAERVPVGDGEAEVVLHRLAFDDFVLVVVVKGEHVLALRALEANLLDIGKCGHGGYSRSGSGKRSVSDELSWQIARCRARGGKPGARKTVQASFNSGGRRDGAIRRAENRGHALMRGAATFAT